MKISGNIFSNIKLAVVCLAVFASLSLTLVADAQEGHPLNGSWSGERMIDGKASRILLVMELDRNQTITGYVLENRQRTELENVKLNPDDWSVSFALAGQAYQVQGVIGELGSRTERTIKGTWTDGAKSGTFSVGIN